MFGWTHRHTPSSHSVHSPRVSGARLGAGDAEMRVAPALSEAHRPVSVVQRAGRGLLWSALQTRAGYPSPTPSGGSARHGDVAGAPMRRAPGGRGARRPLGGGLVCAVTGRPITAALNVGSFGRTVCRSSGSTEAGAGFLHYRASPPPISRSSRGIEGSFGFPASVTFQ